MTPSLLLHHGPDDLVAFGGEGSRTASDLLRDAVRRNCPNLIAVHNHPSGDPTPSRDDIRMTNELVLGGELMVVAVLDHIVLGQGRRHVSMAGERLLQAEPKK